MLTAIPNTHIHTLMLTAEEIKSVQFEQLTFK